MAKRIMELETLEVSLVPEGANGKKFLMTKSKNGSEMEKVLKAITTLEIPNYDELERVLKEHNLSSEALTALKAALKLLVAFKDELPQELIAFIANLAGYPLPDGDSVGYIAPYEYGYAYPKLASMIREKMKKAHITEDFISDDLGIEKEVLKKALGGEFSAISREQLISIFKMVDVDFDDYFDTAYSVKIQKSNKGEEVTDTENTNVEAATDEAAKEQQIQQEDEATKVAITSEEASKVQEEPKEEPIAKSVSISEIKELISSNTEEIKKSFVEVLKERDSKIDSLSEEIKKLREAPAAPASESVNSTEEIQKSAKSFWEGII